MIRARPSIAGLLATIALVAVGFAALKVSSRLWANSLFSLDLLCLVGAVAGTIYRKGGARAGFAGFALFGWTYLVIAFGPPPLNNWKDLLVTTPILAILEDKLLDAPSPPARGLPTPPSSRVLPSVPGRVFVELTPWTYWTQIDRSNPFANDSFLRIGHAVFCLWIAAIGGIFCRFLHESRIEPSPSS